MLLFMIRQRILSIFILLFLSITSTAQVDSVWTRCVGGSSTEANGLTLMNNLGSPGLRMDVNSHGIFVVASSTSNNGVVPANYGSEDVWVVKLTHQGDTLWSRVLRGSDFDRPFAIKALIDGGCVIAGRTLSMDGDFVGNHGANDGFVIRLNSVGEVIWKKLYGGTEDDFLYDVIVCSDGDLAVCGESGSSDGDLAGTGSGLSWMMKIQASNGNISWSKTFLGPNGNNQDALENFYRLIELSDGSGFVAAGYSVDNFNNINGDDLYFHKISPTGNSLWNIKLGSTDGPEGIGGLLDAGNGAFYAVGRLAGSLGADVTSGYYGGNGDVWLLKISYSGNKIWDKHFGGTNWDIGFDIAKDTMNYVYISGFTRSADQVASASSFGLQDFWIIKTDSSGQMIWNKRMGGAQNDVLHSINIYHHQLFVMGRTNSSDQWIHHSFGDRDIWLAQLLQADGLKDFSISDVNDALKIFPNPGQNYFQVSHAKEIINIGVYDMRGLKIFETTQSIVSLPDLQAGLYLINVMDETGNSFYRTWIKN